MTEENVEQNPVEARARTMGWKPPEEFRGNPDNFVSAEKFIELGETSLPHLKGTLKVMETKIAEQNKLIESLKTDFSEFVEFSRSAEQRAYDKAVADLQAKQQKAKEDQDMDAFVEATDALDKKIKEAPLPPKEKPAGKQLSPQEEFAEWHAAGEDAYKQFLVNEPWFTETPKLFVFAKQMDEFLHAKYGLSKSRAERLKEMADLTKKEFPEYFGNKSARRGSPVEGDSGGRRASGNGKTYADLPPDVQKQCDKFTGKDGKGTTGSAPGLTREQFCEQYFGKETSHG